MDFKQTIKTHNGILYKIARSYTTEEADFQDLYQEILIQLWQSFGNFKGQSKLSTWIYRVALNTAIAFTRKSNHRQSPVSEIPESADPEPSSTPEQKEQKIQLLYQCIHRLPKDDRAIILLYLEGKKYDEMAEIIGISSSHVGVKLSRIKKKLQSYLIQEGYGRI